MRFGFDLGCELKQPAVEGRQMRLVAQRKGKQISIGYLSMTESIPHERLESAGRRQCVRPKFMSRLIDILYQQRQSLRHG